MRTGILTLFLVFYFLFSLISILALKFYNINILLIISLSLSVVVIFINIHVMEKGNKYIHIMSIFVIGATLVYTTSLWGDFVRLTDNTYEYPLIQEVVSSKWWSPGKISHRIYETFTVLFLPAIIYNISSLELIYIYKIVVPFVSLLIPLLLYLFYSKQFNTRVSFLSSILFVSMFIFNTWICVTIKMVLSELFMALVLYMFISHYNTSFGYRLWIVLILLLVGIISSHYGTSYLLIYVALATIIVNSIIRRAQIHITGMINFKFLVLYSVVTLAYYTYVSTIGPGSSFEGFIFVIMSTLKTMLTVGLGKHYTIDLLHKKTYVDIELLKYLYLSYSLAVVIGLISKTIVELKSKKIQEFTIVSWVFLVVYVFSNTVGGTQYGGGRIISMSSIFLAPYCILGIYKVLYGVFLILNNFFVNNVIKTSNMVKYVKLFCTIYVILFFILNSGLFSEIILKHNVGSSIYISAPRVITTGTVEEKEVLYRITMFTSEFQNIKWMKVHYVDNIKIYADYHGRIKFWTVGITYRRPYEGYGIPAIVSVSYNLFSDPGPYYVYLSKFNIETKKFQLKLKYHFLPNLIDMKEVLYRGKLNKIYTNVHSETYLKN
ncbi:DUF2206 domain-containing protein [Pyrococcus kukulkanii]|uniref:DUF2206 domain-containing protein n=1 Tax=Pyrococcus kukulkanii TaxID=1609559 RepID=UPI003565C241